MKIIENLIGMDCNFLGRVISSIGGRPARISRNQAMQVRKDFSKLCSRPIIGYVAKAPIPAASPFRERSEFV
jgi:hypothetical protein